MIKGLLLVPILLLGVFILYEAAGMAVNHAAGARQTSDLVRLLERELPQVEILDRYTETGNTSGTGNHVDLLSVVLFRTEAGAEEIRQILRDYEDLDEWSFWCMEMEEVRSKRETYPAAYYYLEDMNLPENLEHAYLLYLNTSAPFPDNIEGH